MPALAQTHLPGDQRFRRKPLQDKNLPANQPPLELKPNKQWIDIPAAEFNKENCCNYRPAMPTPAVSPPVKVESLESSLAEELSAVRKKMERLRQDKEKTERMLRERDRLMDMQSNEMEDRGELQKQLEMEVDRLFRLKELRSYCMRISPIPIRSLRLREREREREREKKINANGPSHTTGSQDDDDDDAEESVGSTAADPISDLDLSELVTEP